MEKTNKKSKRRRSYSNTPFTDKNRKTKKEKIIEKAKTEPLTKNDLLNLIGQAQNFLGIFASDEINHLRLLKYPISLIINTDFSSEPGSHWIALHITKTHVEIFDSLGFQVESWSFYPRNLISFLKKFYFTHQYRISPVLQPPNTFTCGLFCYYFIVYRPSTTFNALIYPFSKTLINNNFILYNKIEK